MPPEQQRIAIAEACGWRRETREGRSPGYALTYWTGPDGRGYGIHPLIPDYLNDLNAMHKAIMTQPVEIRDKINCRLFEILDPQKPYILDRAINATAAQRAEAFLRTIGKWVDA